MGTRRIGVAAKERRLSAKHTKYQPVVSPSAYQKCQHWADTEFYSEDGRAMEGAHDTGGLIRGITLRHDNILIDCWDTPNDRAVDAQACCVPINA